MFKHCEEMVPHISSSGYFAGMLFESSRSVVLNKHEHKNIGMCHIKKLQDIYKVHYTKLYINNMQVGNYYCNITELLSSNQYRKCLHVP